MSDVHQEADGQAAEAAVQEQVVEQKQKSKAKATGDLIADVAAEVEAATKTKALNALDTLAENVEANYFKIGGYLKVVSDNGWFEGFPSFDVFVYEKYGFQSRKARYLMQIYADLVTKQIPWEKVKHLGWTKLKDLAPVLTVENLDEWVAKAEGLTVLELQALLKAKPEGEGSATTTDEIVKFKFNLKNDQAEILQQALAKAKGELQTEYDTVALENIAASYLQGGTSTVSVDPKVVIQSIGWETTLVLFGELFPNIDLAVTVPPDVAGEQS